MTALSKQIINACCFFPATPFTYLWYVVTRCLDAWTNKLFFKWSSLCGTLLICFVLFFICLFCFVKLAWCYRLHKKYHELMLFQWLPLTLSCDSQRRHALSGGITYILVCTRCQALCCRLFINPTPGLHIQ